MFYYIKFFKCDTKDLFCFSSEEERMLDETSSDELRLQPPSGFSDSRELSEAECDRDLKPAKLSAELVTILTR